MLLAGCTPSPGELPAGVTASIYQQRMDYGPRALEVTVINGSDAPLTIISATYLSGRFDGTTAWERPTTVAAGAKVNLRIMLGAPVCDGQLTGMVQLSYTTADGRKGSAVLTPADEFSTLNKVTAEDCLSEGTAAVATISMGSSIRTEMHGDRLIGLIDVTSMPTGDGGATVSAVTRTILLRPEESDATQWPLSWDLGTVTNTTTLAFEPSNCNPHIVAEDKRGTFFPFLVTLDDGTSGTVFYGVSDEVRGQIYAYIAQYCGW